MKKSEEATVIIEEATTKIKMLCAQAFNLVSFIIIKQQVNDIIKKASNESKELGYSDLSKDCKISLMSLYLALKANIIKGFKDGDWTLFLEGLKTTFMGVINLLLAPFKAVFEAFKGPLTAFAE